MRSFTAQHGKQSHCDLTQILPGYGQLIVAIVRQDLLPTTIEQSFRISLGSYPVESWLGDALLLPGTLSNLLNRASFLTTVAEAEAFYRPVQSALSNFWPFPPVGTCENQTPTL